jgi:hypothetical protein
LNDDTNYYENLPVRPGMMFIKALVEGKMGCNKLKLKIPWTIGMFNNRFLLYTSKNIFLIHRQKRLS